MNFFKKLLLGVLLLLLGAVFSGCTSQQSQDGAIPWSRPATWEGQIPGMGAGPGSGSGH
jgi:hypothetical protein